MGPRNGTINGRPATATLLEHIKSCTVEYQRIEESKQTEQWPCDRAEDFQRAVGSNKVKISHEFIARVQFPLADGRRHEAYAGRGLTIPFIKRVSRRASIAGNLWNFMACVS